MKEWSTYSAKNFIFCEYLDQNYNQLSFQNNQQAVKLKKLEKINEFLVKKLKYIKRVIKIPDTTLDTIHSMIKYLFFSLSRLLSIYGTIIRINSKNTVFCKR